MTYKKNSEQVSSEGLKSFGLRSNAEARKTASLIYLRPRCCGVEAKASLYRPGFQKAGNGCRTNDGRMTDRNLLGLRTETDSVSPVTVTGALRCRYGERKRSTQTRREGNGRSVELAVIAGGTR